MKILLIGEHPYKKDFIDFFQDKHELIESKEDLLEDRKARIDLTDKGFDFVINFYGLNDIEYVSSIISDIRLLNFDFSLSNSKIIHLFNASFSVLDNIDYLNLSKKVNKNCIIIEVADLYTTNLKDGSYINELIQNSLKAIQNTTITSYNILNLFLNGIIDDKPINNYKIRIADYYIYRETIEALFNKLPLDIVKSHHDNDLYFKDMIFLNREKCIEVLKSHIDKNMNNNNSEERFYNEYMGQLIFEPKLNPPIGAKFAVMFDKNDIY